MFLRLEEIMISSRATGRVNSNSGYGLESPYEYLLEDATEAMDKLLQKVENEGLCKKLPAMNQE